MVFYTIVQKYNDGVGDVSPRYYSKNKKIKKNETKQFIYKESQTLDSNNVNNIFASFFSFFLDILYL